MEIERTDFLSRRRNTQEIELTVNTRDPEGLLFWQGQDVTVDGAGKDYVALALVDGRVEFR